MAALGCWGLVMGRKVVAGGGGMKVMLSTPQARAGRGHAYVPSICRPWTALATLDGCCICADAALGLLNAFGKDAENKMVITTNPHIDVSTVHRDKHNTHTEYMDKHSVHVFLFKNINV